MAEPFKLIIIVSEFADGSHPVGVSSLSFKYEETAETAYKQLCEKPYIKVHRAYDLSPRKATTGSAGPR